MTTLTLSFWAVVLSAAIDYRATAPRFLPDCEMALVLGLGSNVEISSSESIDEVCFFSLADGVNKRFSLVGSL